MLEGIGNAQRSSCDVVNQIIALTTMDAGIHPQRGVVGSTSARGNAMQFPIHSMQPSSELPK